jgi:hypothetical protein
MTDLNLRASRKFGCTIGKVRWILRSSRRMTNPSPAVMPAQAGIQEVGVRRRHGRLDSPVTPENDDAWNGFLVVVVVIVVVIVF